MKLYIFTAAVVVALAFMSARALASPPDRLNCDLKPTTSAPQARIKATCVRAAKTFRLRAASRGEGYRVRVDENACERVEGTTYRCRVHGFIGDLGCKAVVRTTGVSRDPARLEVRLTYFQCVR
jgi:hypothetical protein